MIKWWNNTKMGIYRTENSHFGIKIPSIEKGDGINVLKLSILSSLLLVHKLILPFDDKVANSLELGSATFWAKKRQKEPQIFFTENATILIKGATIWDFFLQVAKCRMHFYYIYMWQFLPKFHILIYFQHSLFNPWKNLVFNIFSAFFCPPQKFFGATRNSKRATPALKSHFWQHW